MLVQSDIAGSRRPVIWIILALGIAFTLLLQLSILDEVFFSGDGGLKALLVKQFASGDWHPDLRIKVEHWENELWKEGLYPFAPPFVYEIHDKHYMQYPISFAVVSAPLYRLFGFRGLYIIPLMSVWIIWIRYYFLSRRLNLELLPTCLGLVGLIFASHLTLYSAMFWEHTLSCALSFCGVAEILSERDHRGHFIRKLFGGLLLGASVWFRPECAGLLPSVLVAVLVLKLSFKRQVGFIFAALSMLAGFLILNYVIYGSFLGLHAFQVIDTNTLRTPQLPAARIGLLLSRSLIIHCPVILLTIAISALGLKWPSLRPSRIIACVWIIFIIFCLTTLAILPTAGGKQFGPRFWLPAIPLIWLIASFQAKQLTKIAQRIPAKIGMFLFILMIIVGVQINTYKGTKYIYEDYRNSVLPTLRFLRETKETIVVISHQWIAQQLASAFDIKIFFKTANDTDFMRLSRSLFLNKETHFILIRFDPYVSEIQRDPQFLVHRKYLGRYGSYFHLFRCSIQPVALGAS
jgi:hypothetical protein